MFSVTLSLLAAFSPSALPVQDTLLVRGDRVIVRPGEVLEGAAVLVQGGRITAVGPDLVAPEGARVVEGAVVCAGFLDAWSALGLDPESADDAKTSAGSLATDAVDGYRDLNLREEALRAGITAVRVQAGMRSEVAGVGAVIRTDPELHGSEIVLLGDACAAASVGVTRLGRTMDVFDRASDVDSVTNALAKGRKLVVERAEYERDIAAWEEEIAEAEKELEKDFKKAKKDREKDIEKAEEKGKEHKEKRYKEAKRPKAPKADADDDVMARVAQGELPLVVEVHRAEELRDLLERTREFPNLRLVIAGGTEAGHYAEQLAERKIPVIVWPAPYRADGLDEYTEHRLDLAADLDEAGVQVVLGSGGLSPATTRDLPLLAALAVGHGLDPDTALEAMTLGAARAFDVADELGSIERGKSADLLVLDGDPLDTTTRVQYVVSDGRIVVQP